MVVDGGDGDDGDGDGDGGDGAELRRARMDNAISAMVAL
jgi:hypothetical protein